jgi:hypothetical protein
MVACTPERKHGIFVSVLWWPALVDYCAPAAKDNNKSCTRPNASKRLSIASRPCSVLSAFFRLCNAQYTWTLALTRQIVYWIEVLGLKAHLLRIGVRPSCRT